MNERRGILAGGNWIIDHVKIIDWFPAQDGLTNIRSESLGTGGSPYNVLVDLAILGAPFPLQAVGLVGDDSDGRAILSDCWARGIDSTQLKITRDAPTSYTDVMSVQSTGRRTFFHHRGANALLGPDDFKLEESNARILHLGYLLLLDRMDTIHPDGSTPASRLLQRALEAGFKTSVDVVSEDSDRFRAVVTPALPCIDYLVINEFEAERITGIPIKRDDRVDSDRLVEAARRLLESGVRELVVIHVPDGAVAVRRGEEPVWQGRVRLPPEQIAGAAGAGDAFASGILFGLHERWPLQDALVLGVCSASASLTDPTCTGGMRPAAECLERGRELGFQTYP